MHAIHKAEGSCVYPDANAQLICCLRKEDEEKEKEASLPESVDWMKVNEVFEWMKNHQLMPDISSYTVEKLYKLFVKIVNSTSSFVAARKVFGDEAAAYLFRTDLIQISSCGSKLCTGSGGDSKACVLISRIDQWVRCSRVIQDYVSEIISCCVRSGSKFPDIRRMGNKKTLKSILINLHHTVVWFERLKETCSSKKFQMIINNIELISQDCVKGAKIVDPASLNVCGSQGDFVRQPILRSESDYMYGPRIQIRAKQLILQSHLNRSIAMGMRALRRGSGLVQLHEPHTHASHLEQPPAKDHQVYGVPHPFLKNAPFPVVLKMDSYKAALETLLADLTFFLRLEGTIISTRMIYGREKKAAGLQCYTQLRTYGEVCSQGQTELNKQFSALSFRSYLRTALMGLIAGDRDMHIHNLFLGEGMLLLFDLNKAMPVNNSSAKNALGQVQLPFRTALLDFPHADKSIEGELLGCIRLEAAEWVNNDFGQFKKYLATPMGSARSRYLPGGGFSAEQMNALQERLGRISYLVTNLERLTFRQLVYFVFPSYKLMETIEKLITPRQTANNIGYRTFNKAFLRLLLVPSVTVQKKVEIVSALLIRQIFTLHEVLWMLNQSFRRHKRPITEKDLCILINHSAQYMTIEDSQSNLELIVSLFEAHPSVIVQAFAYSYIHGKISFEYCKALYFAYYKTVLEKRLSLHEFFSTSLSLGMVSFSTASQVCTAMSEGELINDEEFDVLEPCVDDLDI